MRRILSALMTAAILIVSCPATETSAATKCKTDWTVQSPTVTSGVTSWDCIYYGTYPQSDATGRTKEPIKWRVLNVDGDSAVLMADSNLDRCKFNDTYNSVSWETSTVRTWLNTYFLNTAFTEDEQTWILETNLSEDANLTYGTKSNATIDKVYLLSESEAQSESYGFSSLSTADKGRIRRNTAYVAAGGYTGTTKVMPYAENKADLWWLRTSGSSQNFAAYVDNAGKVLNDGDLVNKDNCVICPVIRLDISKASWTYAGTVDSNENYTTVPVQINGYQISTGIGGMRILYSVESKYKGQDVIEKGLVYGLEESVAIDELTVGSSNADVHSYQATTAGMLVSNLTTSNTATSYAMTMKFAVGSSQEFGTNMLVRAYAKLNDGSYIYSDAFTYNIYSIAEYLYRNKLMATEFSHNYLYNDIIKIVNTGYSKVVWQ